jgi:hypothetical protein
MYEEENIKPEFEEMGKSNPFRTPDDYFGSIEDRIMGRIEDLAKPKNNASRIIRFLKPALGLAASFTLVYLLVYYPINILLLKNTAKTEVFDSVSTDPYDAYSLSFSLVDENTLVNALFTDESNNTNEINPDDMLAYLSTGMNELEIYSEIQN